MSQTWFQEFYQQIATSNLSEWLETLPADIKNWQQQPHGEWQKWLRLLAKFPATQPTTINFKDAVKIGTANDIDAHTQKQITGLLGQFKPWRKGPFHIHDIHIDTEWRSDWKWERLAPYIDSLEGKYVLDVGCGNGYHMFRMLDQNPELVVGIDPTALFLIQFQIIKHFCPDPRIHLMPLGIEQMPALGAFDTVFSMGVLYHRKSPFDFLQQLKKLLKPGGQLVLETLVVDGDQHTVLVPHDRYAQMSNVWFIPSVAALEQWLSKCGFSAVHTVDVADTSLDEQRKTSWMDSQSLADFLDPDDVTKTIEGYPAPKRAVTLAKA